MLRWLGHWVRTTFDYNPTFPLSAFLLLAGLKRLAHDGFLDFAQEGSTLAGLSILQGYELCLLGVALFVLWPRRIAYETTAIFIIFGLARFAAPFVAISFAAEGNALEAALLGLGLAGLSIGKTEAIARRVLPAEGWERVYDGALQVVACAGLPLVAHGLSKGTGAVFSHDAARLLQLGGWWSLALLLAPLALRVPDLGRSSALHVPGPTAVLRGWLARRTGLNLVGMPFLLGSALWLGGNEPVLFQVFPLALVVLGVTAAVTRKSGATVPAWFTHAPAALAALVVLAPLDVLLGKVAFLSHAACILAFLPVAAAAVPLIAPGEIRSGLRSLAVVAGAAPLLLARTPHERELYLLAVSFAFALVGLVKRNDRLLAHGALAAAALGVHLTWQGSVRLATDHILAFGAGFALIVALRVREAKLAAAVALVACFAPAGAAVLDRSLETRTLALGIAAAASAAFLGWRQGEKAVVKSGVASATLLLIRRFGAELDTGAGLVVLAFASIGAGTAIALRRERLERARRDRLEEDLALAATHAARALPPAPPPPHAAPASAAGSGAVLEPADELETAGLIW